MEGNMVRLMRRCQLAKSTREAARALKGKVRMISLWHDDHNDHNISWDFALMEKRG